MSRQLGIGFVHQDLGLVPSLTVLDNLRIGTFASKTSWRLSWRAERRAALELLDEYGLQVDPAAKVAKLRPTERAMLAIVRAVQDIREVTERGDTTGLLVLDETTVFLPADEKDHLFRVVREIARKSASVLFVSHDLDEVREITDTVTVLRDGRVQGSVSTAKVTVGELVEMIVGRAVDIEQIERRVAASDAPAVVVADLQIDDVRYPSIETHAGEVVGLTGLPGTGFDRLPYAVFGAESPQSGTLMLNGQTHDLRRLNPIKAVRLGIGLLPADRQRQGSVGSLPVEDNVMSPVLSRFRTPVGLSRRAVTSASRDLMERFDVRPRDPAKTFQSLSGGNQQKALVGKWLQLGMRLWLLHEPTQGVDVGARQQIFRDVRAAAAGGMTVLCASNDHEQLALLCDRVLVFGSGGRIRELTGAGITKRNIGAACFDVVDSIEVSNQNGDGKQ
jgi:ribose transport system ATP-binding protein